MREANFTSHHRHLAHVLTRAVTVILIAILTLLNNGLAQSKNQRLQEVESELQAIEVWLSKNKRLKQDWLKELKLADLEVQALKKIISASNQKLQTSEQSLEKLKAKETELKSRHSELSRTLFEHIKNAYKLQKSSPLKKLSLIHI